MSLAEQIPDGAARKALRSPVLAFVCDEATLEAVSRVVPGGRRGVEVCEGGIETALKVLNADQSPDLLIVDDLGLRPLANDEPMDLYEVIRQRYERGSLVITSNRAIEEWPPLFHRILLNGIRDAQRRRSVRSKLFGFLPQHHDDERDDDTDLVERIPDGGPDP